jgi:hypothetical protein
MSPIEVFSNAIEDPGSDDSFGRTTQALDKRRNEKRNKDTDNFSCHGRRTNT